MEQHTTYTEAVARFKLAVQAQPTGDITAVVDTFTTEVVTHIVILGTTIVVGPHSVVVQQPLAQLQM